VQLILRTVPFAPKRNILPRGGMAAACVLAAFSLLAAASAMGQPTSKATLETGQPMFAVLTGMNLCGYDQELDASPSMRKQIREEVAAAARASQPASEAARHLCEFYRDHRQAKQSADLAQYVSLALNLQGPPFATTMQEADLPPDAAYVLGFVPLLQRFYDAAGIHAIWLKHRPEYDALVEAAHDPISNMLMATDVYLKMPISGYAGRSFTLHIEPMAAPGQVNARNYGENYFIEFAPERGVLPMKQIRHTYLHFILDPLAAKHGTALRRLDPLMNQLQPAPMDAAFKRDTSLMVNECLIRAIEARLTPGKPAESETTRRQEVERAASEGFVLTPFFFEQLIQFEKTPESLRDAYPDFLHNLDVDHERKRMKSIVFAQQADPELVRGAKPEDAASLVEKAERRLASGDADGAQHLAQQALDRHQGDAGPALFVLAKAAARKKDMAGARAYFTQALAATKDPHVVGWSHIYLGRIYDLKAERDAAIEQYRAALKDDALPEVQAAAERGLKQAYEPPTAETGSEQGPTAQPETGRGSDAQAQPGSGMKQE
jgi:tetratricopeptide (TPR) repeat protein